MDVPVQDACIVEVDLDSPLIPAGHVDDLISRLSAQLSRSASTNGQGQQVIIQPSEVVTFQLVRRGGGRDRRAIGLDDKSLFRYPISIYLDQFLASNAELAKEKRTSAADMVRELGRLQGKGNALRWFQVCALVGAANWICATNFGSRAKILSSLSARQFIIMNTSPKRTVMMIVKKVSRLWQKR